MTDSARIKHPVTARTKARRRAVEILFEADQRGLLRADQAVENLRGLAAERAVRSANHTEAPAYAREILTGVADHLAQIDEYAETYSQGWSLARMPAVDRAIARVTIWEMVYNDDVDVPVALDEAQTLAKMLSTQDSPRFLGGLLGRIGDLAETLR
nr:transcription antitermination factor NusB [Actinomyces sp.]